MIIHPMMVKYCQVYISMGVPFGMNVTTKESGYYMYMYVYVVEINAYSRYRPMSGRYFGIDSNSIPSYRFFDIP